MLFRSTFNGKGQHHSIDHINRIGRDNRKVNLRELTQSHQNINQSKRDREVKLPDGIGEREQNKRVKSSSQKTSGFPSQHLPITHFCLISFYIK